MAVDNNSYNKGGLIAFIGSFAFSLILFIVLVFVYKGIEIDQIKQKIQQDEAVPVAETTFDINAVEDITVTSDDIVEYGRKVYEMNCAVCHGQKGLGDGPAGAALNPKPRNLVEGKWTQGGTSIELFNTIQNGIPGTSMAPFGHVPVKDRWAIVHFIRSITKNKSADNEVELKEFAKTAQ